MNRLSDSFRRSPEEGSEDDYFVIYTEDCRIPVTQQTAARVLTELSAAAAAEWLRFRDLTGSLVMLRSALVQSVEQSTAAQRRAKRAFWRARKKERAEESDGLSWEDDED